MAPVLKLSPDLDLETIIQRAVRVLGAGGVIAYPTETFYGLGVDAANEAAVRKIFDIKGRNFQNPVSVIIGYTEQLHALAATVSPAAQKIIDAFWPGAITIVFEAAPNVSKLLTAGTGKIGVRLSSHPFARGLATQIKSPVTATSANLSGQPACNTADEVQHQIGDKIDAIIDLDEKGGTLGSTIVDATSASLVMVRAGMISSGEIETQTGLTFK